MKQKECPACAIDVDKEEEICPYCGYEFPVQKKTTMIVVWLLIILMLLWVFT